MPHLNNISDLFAQIPSLVDVTLFSFIFFDPRYLLMVAPAFLLAMWAQMRISATYNQAQEIPAPMSGASAARHILDSAGLQHVDIEITPGHLSDHYDPRAKVLRLSNEVYQQRTLAAVGIAAHEAGHALQDARDYVPLIVRNAAVPAASFGTNFAWILFFIGLFIQALSFLTLVGLVLFGAVAFFQIVNLPVEYNASSRAKAQLASLGIVPPEDMVYVRKVLGAAALTYVAAMLMAVLQFLYFALRYAGAQE
jgi:hypothetical protein